MAGPRFFKSTPRPGKPLSLKGLATGLALLEKALMNLSVHLGHVDWHGHEPKIVVERVDGYDYAAGAAELDVTVDGDTFTVAAGELVVGTRLISYPADSVDGSGASVGERRWIYAEIDLGTLATAAGITADKHKAVDSFTDSEQLYRINLSLWEKTLDGWALAMKPHPGLHQHGIVSG